MPATATLQLMSEPGWSMDLPAGLVCLAADLVNRLAHLAATFGIVKHANCKAC